MLRLLLRIPRLCNSKQQLNPTHIRFLYSSTPKAIPKSPDLPNPTSLAASYLISSCGLSIEAALSAAKSLHLKSPENPNAVLALLKDIGFNKTHIANLITKHPKLLSADPERTIKPKLEFFLGIGFSAPDLAKLVTADHNLLISSLEKKLIPNFELLKSLLGTREAAVAALSCTSRLLRYNLEKMLLPNMKILRDHGVPGQKIVKLATLYPRVLMQRSDRFGKTVEVLKELGFNPTSMMFVLGINAMSGLSSSMWERKLEVYRSVGWSEKETLLAFTKHPFCMLASEEKIRQGMDFFVNKLHWEPSFLSARPKLLSLSFEKRIVPRCSVLSVLSSRGLVRRNLGAHTVLLIPEKDFLDKYVMKYREEAPEVLEAYQGRKNVKLKAEIGGPL